MRKGLLAAWGLRLMAAAVPMLAPGPVAAQSGLSQEGFEAYLPQLRQQAEREGVRRDTIERIFPTLAFSARTVQLDRGQPGGVAGSSAVPPFQPYRERHVSAALVAKGRQRYADYIGRLNEIGRRTGVTPSVMVAIWGHETSYGAVTGDFDLLNSLASLAYEGRRRQLFADEFVATLKMLDRGYPRSSLKGSWAGATGQSQFLPSVYLRVATDGDGDGRADIWRSSLDALASIGNYLRDAGWKPNTPWGLEVNVPAGFSRTGMTTRLISPRCPRVHERHSRWLTIAEWRRMGVTTRGAAWPDEDELATLLEPDGPGRPAFLLTTNYRTILDYNCSNFYALSVGLLADAVAR
jgi:lytic murein transglycosylase